MSTDQTFYNMTVGSADKGLKKSIFMSVGITGSRVWL